VSAWQENRATKRVEVTSEAGATLRLANPFGGPMKVRHPGGHSEVLEDAVVEIATTAGEHLMLTPAHISEQ